MKFSNISAVFSCFNFVTSHSLLLLYLLSLFIFYIDNLKKILYSLASTGFIPSNLRIYLVRCGNCCVNVLSAVLAFVYLPYALVVGTDLIRPKWTEKQQQGFSNKVQRELTKLCKLAGN